MQRLIAACRAAVLVENWHAALVVALTLPDIASKIDAGIAKGTGALYAAWWDRILTPTQVLPILPNFELGTLIDGRQAYKLRCRVLHEGRAVLRDEPLQRFKLVSPNSAGDWGHALGSSEGPLLDVSVLCEDICSAVEQWLITTAWSDPRMRRELEGMLVIDAII